VSGKLQTRPHTLISSNLIHSYLSADYERGVFNVSACAWNEDAEQNIVTIRPQDSESSTCSGSECSSSAGSSEGSSALSPGAAAGIAIAALVGVVILAVVLFFFIRRQRQKAAYKATPPEPDVSVLSGPVLNAVPPDPAHTDQSPPQSRFWSPDAVCGGAGGSSNGESRRDGGNTENSADEHGLELDGHGTEIKPVYHELPGSEVWRPGPDPGSVVRISYA
jgi:hypothetical protein